MNASTVHGVVLVAALSLAVSIGACGDSQTPSLQAPCGDGFCLGDEDEISCPRDCPFECLPGVQRCAGNAVLTCRPDGASESAQFCAPDEICVDAACVPSPGLVPDAGTDPDLDVADDVPLDSDADTHADATGDADDVTSDAPDDAGDQSSD